MTRGESTGPTRRRLLRTGLNLGVGAGLVWGGGASLAATDDTVEVDYARVREPGVHGALSARTTTVPADWYRSVQAAYDVQRTLVDAGLSSVVGAFVVPGSFDDPAASVAVDATDTDVEDVAEDLDDHVRLDVDVLDEQPLKPDRSGLAEEPFRLEEPGSGGIPGGGFCRSPEMGGTLAPAAYDAHDGERFFLTSNHLYGDAGAKETEHRGTPLELTLDSGTRRIGRVVRGHPKADFVRVAPVDGNEPASELARAVPGNVVGQFTRMGLAARMARDEGLEKYGAISGHTAGEIHGVDGFTCYLGRVCKAGQLKWGDRLTMTDGDSGSVAYAPDPERPDEAVIVAGMNNARSWWPGADFTWGTAAFHLLERYGVHF